MRTSLQSPYVGGTCAQTELCLDVDEATLVDRMVANNQARFINLPLPVPFTYLPATHTHTHTLFEHDIRTHTVSRALSFISYSVSVGCRSTQTTLLTARSYNKHGLRHNKHIPTMVPGHWCGRGHDATLARACSSIVCVCVCG